MKNSDYEITQMFCVRTANELLREASLMEAPKPLYRNCVFEHEITMVMADTNVGKSVFTLQMANVIAKSQPVLYLDFEQSPKQFERRYSDNFTNHYKFSKDLFWVNFAEGYKCNPDEKYEECFIRSLLTQVKKCNAKVVVIDNMTKLLLTDTDTAQNAKPMMDMLCNLKMQYGLTLILVEHTRKMNKARPIQLDDLQGSKMKVNFADSVIAIGRSNINLDQRYIKHLKCRSAEIENDADNVLVYELCKKSNFLGFKYIGIDSEYNLIKGDAESIREQRAEQIKQMKEEGLSNREIAKRLGVSEGCIRKNVAKLNQTLVPESTQ